LDANQQLNNLRNIANNSTKKKKKQSPTGSVPDIPDHHSWPRRRPTGQWSYPAGRRAAAEVGKVATTNIAVTRAIRDGVKFNCV